MSQKHLSQSASAYLIQSAKTHKVGLLIAGVGGLITVIGAWCLDVLKKALLYSIENYLQPCLWVLTIVAFAYVMERLFHWKRVAELALDKASKVDDLTVMIEAERGNVLQLRASAKPADELDSEQRQILTCIFGSGEITVKQLAKEFSTNVPTMSNRLKPLSLSLQLIHRVGVKGEDEVYGITGKGRKYAETHDIEPIPQSLKELEQSEQEKVIDSLRAEVARLNQPAPKPPVSIPGLVGLVGGPQRAFHPAPGNVSSEEQRKTRDGES